MKFRDVIYNKETKESHLAGVILLIIVILICGAGISSR
jgi:hypothetical protein